MNKITDILSGAKILEEVESPINGKLTVIRDLAWGTYIKGGGLTQSGGVAEKVWRTALKVVKGLPAGRQVKSCLILGLGGGGIAKIVHKYWHGAKIVGVDVDTIIVDLGKKYLGLNEVQVQVQVQDALLFCQRAVQKNEQFDLICIDTYVGDHFPEKFESDEFLELVLELLTPEGGAVFNRLYYGEKRREAEAFHKKLIHVFKKVTPVYPEANVMFVCRN